MSEKRRNWRLSFAVAAVLLAAGVAGAAVESAAEFLQIVQQRVDRGELTADEALLLKFRYAFDRSKLPADLQPIGKAPMKCGTPLIVEYTQRGAALDARHVARSSRWRCRGRVAGHPPHPAGRPPGRGRSARGRARRRRS